MARRASDTKGKAKRAVRSKAERLMMVLATSDVTAEIHPKRSDVVTLPGYRLSISKIEADELVARDLAHWRCDGHLAATDAGRSWARRSNANAVPPHRQQHGDVGPGEGATAGAVVDRAESPLLWLFRRGGKDGKRLIGEAMFAAGERLRADFTFGNMAPRTTLNWTFGGRSPSTGGGPEPTESALAARQRVRRALDAVGPELTGVLLDVCCFLKGLEDVERDQRWPARSAKVILSLALERLARHYGYSDTAQGPVRRQREPARLRA